MLGALLCVIDEEQSHTFYCYVAQEQISISKEGGGVLEGSGVDNYSFSTQIYPLGKVGPNFPHQVV